MNGRPIVRHYWAELKRTSSVENGVKRKRDLSSPCRRTRSVLWTHFGGQSTYFQQKTCVSSFQIVQIHSPMQERSCVAGDLAAGVVQPLTKTIPVRQRETPSPLGRSKKSEPHNSCSSRRKVPRELDSWLGLRRRTPLTLHPPVFVAIKTQTLPRSFGPPLRKNNTQLKQKQSAGAAARFSTLQLPRRG